MGGKEERWKERREGSSLFNASLAPIVFGCNNYQILIISAIYYLFLIGSPRKTTRPTITGFLSILFTYELPKCFRKCLACGRLYIAHLLRITYLCCFSFEKQLLYFYQDTTARHPAEDSATTPRNVSIAEAISYSEMKVS